MSSFYKDSCKFVIFEKQILLFGKPQCQFNNCEAEDTSVLLAWFWALGLYSEPDGAFQVAESDSDQSTKGG